MYIYIYIHMCISCVIDQHRSAWQCEERCVCVCVQRWTEISATQMKKNRKLWEADKRKREKAKVKQVSKRVGHSGMLRECVLVT